MSRTRLRYSASFSCVAMAAALAVSPAMVTASEAQTTGNVASAPDPVQCRSYIIRVKQFATDLLRQSIWAQLCYTGRPTSNTPVQILIHGGAYNHTYWDSPFKPETYSYVRAATMRGYVTLNFDRLGYGQSDRPLAATLDFNVAGFVTHQLVQTLRDGLLGIRFTKVILNGHSMGALAAENEAANYHDVDGLIVSGIGHNFNLSPNLLTIFVPAATDPKYVGQVAAATYLTSQPNGRAGVFIAPGSYDPDIVPYEEGVEKDTLAPTELTALTVDTSDLNQLTQRITTPTLFAQGRYDQLWCNRSGDCQTDPQALKEPSYWPATSFTRVVIPDAGHSINSNKTATTFYDATFSWLQQHGLAPR